MRSLIMRGRIASTIGGMLTCAIVAAQSSPGAGPLPPEASAPQTTTIIVIVAAVVSVVAIIAALATRKTPSAPE